MFWLFLEYYIFIIFMEDAQMYEEVRKKIEKNSIALQSIHKNVQFIFKVIY